MPDPQRGASFNVGRRWRHFGTGAGRVRRNRLSTAEWLQSVYEIGKPEELVKIAKRLRDDKEAARWFRRAAEQGSAEARYRLVRMYAAGRGVPRNTQAAHILMRAAARQGHKRALALLDKARKRQNSN